MLGEIFYWVLNMSISASVCGGIVMLIRMVKRIPRRVVKILWLIPFIRMCVPFSIPGKYGLMSLISRVTTVTVTVGSVGGIDLSMVNHAMGAESYFPITYKIDRLAPILSVAALIWLGILCLLIAALVSAYVLSMRELRSAVPLYENVFLCKEIHTPAVYGILRPRIMIPYGYDAEQTEYVVLHEKMHVATHDNLLRIGTLLLICVHWFNPLCLVFLRQFYIDMELACDERVLARCTDQAQQNAYARVLISSAERKGALFSAFGGAPLRQRLRRILSYRKLTTLSVLGFAALCAAISYILLTNAA